MHIQAPELEGLDRTRETHVAAVNAGDADAWAACFDADAVQMPPNAAHNVGAQSIRAWSGALLDIFRAEFSLEPHEVELMGPDRAFERGAYRISLTPRGGGGTIHDAGKYLTVYRRQSDETWAMTHDIWNSDDPLPS